MYSGTCLCGWRWSGSIVSHLRPILPDIGLLQEPICLRLIWRMAQHPWACWLPSRPRLTQPSGAGVSPRRRWSRDSRLRTQQNALILCKKHGPNKAAAVCSSCPFDGPPSFRIAVNHSPCSTNIDSNFAASRALQWTASTEELDGRPRPPEHDEPAGNQGIAPGPERKRKRAESCELRRVPCKSLP